MNLPVFSRPRRRPRSRSCPFFEDDDEDDLAVHGESLSAAGPSRCKSYPKAPEHWRTLKTWRTKLPGSQGLPVWSLLYDGFVEKHGNPFARRSAILVRPTDKLQFAVEFLHQARLSKIRQDFSLIPACKPCC
jgi:hypothetical protein